MTDYRAVMDLVLQGWSVRQICSTVRCSHTTVQKARHTMAAHQITTDEQLAGITCLFGVVGTVCLGLPTSCGQWFRRLRG
ncbi:helix-turn-helix domain-containing protein [Corynebacterium pyruviciproducens]|uniref:Uncharacterized protein n=2 Tax=Corynebacterium pyruviciproducens TaxID=598660 RepID=S2ZFC0_9CORY|nr:hypothetical protein HMPREF1219_01873 [Corynebacterium pyruviciproducens ATCC BAA-1742]